MMNKSQFQKITLTGFVAQGHIQYIHLAISGIQSLYVQINQSINQSHVPQ